MHASSESELEELLSRRKRGLEIANRIISILNEEGNEYPQSEKDQRLRTAARSLCSHYRSSYLSVRKTRDGYLLVDAYGTTRFLSFWESLAWKYLGCLPVIM